MSDDSQRGYLFGILQRGARPVGRPNFGHRVLSGQGALEHSSSVNHSSAPIGVAWLGKSSSAAELNTTTQSPIRSAGFSKAATQTRDSFFDQVQLTPADIPSESSSAAELNPSTQSPIRSAGSSKAAIQTRDSSFDQVKLTPADIPSESSSAAELNSSTQSPIRSAGFSKAAIQTRDSSFDQVQLTPADIPSESSSAAELNPSTQSPIRSAGFSKAATQTRDSSFDQVKLTPADISSESSSAAELNPSTQSPIRSTGFSKAATQTRDSSFDQVKLTPADISSESSSAAELNPSTQSPIRSTGFSKAATQTGNSSFDQVQLTPADIPSESCAAAEISTSTQSRIQTKQVAHPQIRRSGPHSPNHAAEASPKTVTDAGSTGFSTAATQTGNSSFDQAKLSATERDANLLPVGYSVHTTVTPAPADRRFSEPRLPRLVVIEQGGKAISFDNSSPDTKEAARSVVVEENGAVFEPQRVADLRTNDRGRRSTQLLSSQSPTILSPALFEVTPVQDNRNVNREESPSRGGGWEDQAATSLQADVNESSRRSPGSALLNRSPQQESSQSVLANAPKDKPVTPAGHFRVRPSDSIAEGTKVTPALARAERMKESFVRRGSLPAQTEEQYSRGPASQQQPRAAPTPKLTINRLDIQIVNQSPAPTTPLPTAPAVAGLPSDSWENLERHQLGHLHLIF